MKKAKKLIVSGIVSAILVMTTAMSAFAAPSAQNEVAASTDTSKYVVAAYDAAGVDATSASEIAKVNAGTVDVAEFAKTAGLEKELEGKQFATPFFDLDKVGDLQPDAEGFYHVDLKVPALVGAKGVTVLHYNLEDQKFEVLESENFDPATGAIVIKTKNFSPIAFLVDAGSTTVTSGQKAPQTGSTSSAWMLWMSAAFVMAGACAIVAFKKER